MSLMLLPTLRGYDRAWLRADVVAGLSAGAVVVPQAMAYATIANLPVEFGLYTCMVPALVYPLLGGSRALSLSTTSTIATLSASTLLAAGVSADADDPARALCTLTLLVGLILVVARVLKLGSLVENISRATLVGVKVGVGATVAASQLPKLLGVEPDPDASGFFPILGSALRQLDDANVPTVILSVASIAVIVGLGRIAPKIPAPLVVVAAGIVLIAFTGLGDEGVAVIDRVPSGLPLPVLPDLDTAAAMLPGALAIALMAFLETVSVGRGVRRADEPPIDPDRELLANGLAATVGAFFRAMPPAGGFSQSAVNQRAGARTQAAALVTAALAVTVALFLAPVLDDLPQATLGAMVFVATLGLIDVAELRMLWRLSRIEFAIAAATAAIGLTAGLLVAVVAGVLMTLFLVLHEIDQSRLSPLVRASGGGWTTDPDSDGEPTPETLPTPVPGALMLRFDLGLYTANTRRTVDSIVALARATRPSTVILESSALRLVTSTVLDGLTDLDHQLAQFGATLYLVRVPSTTRRAAQASPWFAGLDASGRVQPTVDAALTHAHLSPPQRNDEGA